MLRDSSVLSVPIGRLWHYLYGIDVRRCTREVRVFLKGLPRVVGAAIQLGDKGAENEEMVQVGGFHGLHGGPPRSSHSPRFQRPMRFCSFSLPKSRAWRGGVDCREQKQQQQQAKTAH